MITMIGMNLCSFLSFLQLTNLKSKIYIIGGETIK